MESNKKQSTNDIPIDSETLRKELEKNLEGLENLVKLFKSDVNKMFDISSIELQKDQNTYYKKETSITPQIKEENLIENSRIKCD